MTSTTMTASSVTQSVGASVTSAEQDKPTDLSMKTTRKERYKPPPLDLNAHTLEADVASHPEARVPKSPGDLPRECLPIRKR